MHSQCYQCHRVVEFEMGDQGRVDVAITDERFRYQCQACGAANVELSQHGATMEELRNKIKRDMLELACP